METSNLAKKVGQLLVIGFSGKKVTKQVKDLIHNYHVGGIILFGRNIGTPRELLKLTTDLQYEAKNAGYEHPLLICVDQENGIVRRLGEGTTIFPGAMALGATHNPDYAYVIGQASGKELKALGINWNLAPVLDVNNNPDNPVIGVRSFGESAESVAQFGKAAMQGMQAAGVVTTLKHFPGHGDTNVDSHLDLPVIPHDKTRLEKIELYPFQTAIAASADTVMTAHVYFPAIETETNVPATLSSKIITGLLREELGFTGVVTTDCMEMNAIANGIGTEKGSVAAIKAGVDFVMISHTYEKQVGAIMEISKSIANGEIGEGIIDKAVERIKRLKEKYTSWEDIIFKEELVVPAFVGSEKHEKLAYDVYKESVTIVQNNGILPLPVKEHNRILVIHPDNGTTMQVEDKRYAHLSLGDAVRLHHLNVDVYQFPNLLTDQEIDTMIDKALSYDFVIVGTLSVTPGSKQIDLVNKLSNHNIDFVVIAMRGPYDFKYLPEVPAYINTYEFTYPALKVAASAIFGKEKVSGKLPITVKRETE
ncbi:beta-N-acetylhexosaminidase [Bacillus sp. FJAT-50079]|uniref:beta-N-acetylhexosaminidase n=1 Tax=Bacillus sp. FJAT-50079 TaxID=2833577 RepID=UPI001BC9F855|nr:beta-N-acetylhexosaminidase [Bacillus sp. FJAT-50079]MBS4207919.1 beta-N-acetylhexosaminidase [Bacillus sp. FJAT-50079]